jgi:maltooligosyltrehalose trehalohydrolase
LVIAENETQDAKMLRSAKQGGCDLDAAWNDDFHHSARVAMTGRNEFYYGDYRGTPQELLSAIKWGYLYQGQWNARQGHPRGTPALDVPSEQFVVFLENHDQVGNSAHGWRSHHTTSPGRHRALTALLLLSPGTPLLFQGQEFSASSPFFYFANHSDEDLQRLVRVGRHNFMRQFRSLSGSHADNCLVDPGELAAFERSKLDLGERESHAASYRLHRDLLRLRREDPVFSAQRGDRIHGVVLAPEALALRYLGTDGDDRLIVINLGPDLRWNPAAEPLLAPPAECDWRLLWSSEDPCYNGGGAAPLTPEELVFSGHSAVVLAPCACGSNDE